MPDREELTVDEYYEKWQEEIDRLVNDRGLDAVTVVKLPEIALRNGNSAGVRIGVASCAPILEEAREKVNERYKLKAAD